MKVKIVKYSKDYCWYKDRINCVFTVVEDEISPNCYRTINAHNSILKSDCIEVDDEKSLHELLKPKLPKENQMKKLDIKKDYRLEKGIVVNHISDIETEVKLLNDTADVITTIIIGRYGVNLDKANEIINLFNIPYELVDETDWSKVEDGTEIKIIDNGNIVKFMKYIPDLKTVIVREGDCFYTIDEDKVEVELV